MAHRAPSSLITNRWTYDVFLSFYGDDTRLGFTSHLYESLRQSGIHTFLDDESIKTGETITLAHSKAIEESRIAIIVFSENYANSRFCLQELEKIVECFKEEGQLIYPVFYHVDPSELRRPRGSYAQALARLDERFKDDKNKVGKWRLALSQAADLKGFHIKTMFANEHECITRITKEVAARINSVPLHVANYPVGLMSRVKDVISSLDLWSTNEIKMTGIWGVRGIGKSTIARAVYNSIADNFEAVCFLSDVRSRSNMANGLSQLQETLLWKLGMDVNIKLHDHYEGIQILKRRLSHKKILLILDDVDKLDQLTALAGGCDWFGYGSRIIITTRYKHLLVSHGVEIIYQVKELNNDESLKLLSWHAFKKENVDSKYMEDCKRAVHYSRRIPLALAVIGSSLRSKEVNQWSSALETLGEDPIATLKDQQDHDVANPISSNSGRKRFRDDSFQEVWDYYFPTVEDQHDHGVTNMKFDLWEKQKDLIGKGAHGQVYVGFNIKTLESCAIKEIFVEDLIMTQSLHKEIQIFSQLEHKNIVKYYGSETVDSKISIYMEYVKPGALDKYIKSQGGSLQESVVRDFTAQILSGLVYLHSQRVVHRDVKPKNILVDSDNNVKLADFGLSKDLFESVGNHSVLGTPRYAAPELLFCAVERVPYNSLNEACAGDIWSLGCVVIAMFTGDDPWAGIHSYLVFEKVCRLKQHPAIPEELSDAGKDFLNSCFTIDPIKRPTAASLQSHPFATTVDVRLVM